MNKSEIFRKAHSIARAIIKAGDDYRATFAAALRGLNSGTLAIAAGEHLAKNGKTYVQVDAGSVKVGALVFIVTNEGASKFKKNATKKLAPAFVVAGLGKEFDGMVRAYAE